MIESLLAALVIAVLACLVILIDLTWHLRRIYALLQQKPMLLLRHADHHRGAQAAVAYSVWAYQSQRWSLVTTCGRSTCDCGPPPPQPGAYEGQVVRKECAP